MPERQFSAVDRLFEGVEMLLRGVAGPNIRGARSNPADGVPDSPLSATERKHAARLMRVNHAGEVAAQGLYQGHAAIARSQRIADHMRAAALEELDHLSWCEQRLTELGAAPSRLQPLWYAGAFAIGATSGVLGDRWSLGFVEETERQVALHLGGHLDRLPLQDAKSRAIVERMRTEELQHGAAARAAGGTSLPDIVKRLMRLSAKAMTRTSYRI
jgi:ubiquinone biosynthesis monooxygenase Coq7